MNFNNSMDEATSIRQHGELIAFLNNNDDMRKNAKHSFKASLWAGGGACELLSIVVSLVLLKFEIICFFCIKLF